MALRENPVILRQSFNKLWTNNIYLQEQTANRLQFISLYKSKLMADQLLHRKSTKIISNRVRKGDNDLDLYLNLYKYRKNAKKRRKKTKNWKKSVVRQEGQKYSLTGRFRKATMYQQILQEFADLWLNFQNLYFRLREPMRRLHFFRRGQIFRWMITKLGMLKRQKYFRNSINQIILLHYYKVATAFSQHFGREFARVPRQIHWRVVYAFRRMIFTVPTHPLVGRHFYGLLMEIAGRPKGRNRTIVFRILQGCLASQTFRFRVTMGFDVSLAKVGVFGIKTRVAF